MLSYEITKSLSFFCVHSVIVMILCLQMCMLCVCGRLLWLSSIIMTATEEHERGTNTIYIYTQRTSKERKYKVKSGGMSFVWLIISHPHSFISAFSHFFCFSHSQQWYLPSWCFWRFCWIVYLYSSTSCLLLLVLFLCAFALFIHS